jgi:hypothetical protein
MLKTLALVALAAVGALLAYAATRPDTFRVQRSLVVNAPAAKLFPMVNDLRQFSAWNPYEKKDPAIRISYRGAASGPGAGYDFEGNKEVGKGSIDIVDAAAPAKVTMQLTMVEPFEGRNTVEFSLVPQGQATNVTWAMHGPSPFMAKLVGVFMNMDQMIGRDFEAGLANLKTLAERG